MPCSRLAAHFEAANRQHYGNHDKAQPGEYGELELVVGLRMAGAERLRDVEHSGLLSALQIGAWVRDLPGGLPLVEQQQAGELRGLGDDPGIWSYNDFRSGCDGRPRFACSHKDRLFNDGTFGPVERDLSHISSTGMFRGTILGAIMSRSMRGKRTG
jgi:hypothetical protein